MVELRGIDPNLSGDTVGALIRASAETAVLVVPRTVQPPNRADRDGRVFEYPGRSLPAVRRLLQRIVHSDADRAAASIMSPEVQDQTQPEDYTDLEDLLNDHAISYGYVARHTPDNSGFEDVLEDTSLKSIYLRTIGGPAIRFVLDRFRYGDLNGQAVVHGPTFLAKSFDLSKLSLKTTPEGQSTPLVDRESLEGLHADPATGKTPNPDHEHLDRLWGKLDRHMRKFHLPTDPGRACICGLQAVFDYDEASNEILVMGITPDSLLLATPHMQGRQVERSQYRGTFHEGDVNTLKKYLGYIEISKEK